MSVFCLTSPKFMEDVRITSCITNSTKSYRKINVILITDYDVSLKLQDLFISNNRYEKLLAIKKDHELSVEPHKESLSLKASQKLNALSQVVSSLRFEKGRMIS